MLTFLFWNVNKKNLDDLIADLGAAHNVDIMMLAECGSEPFALLERLNRGAMFPFEHAPTMSAGLEIFCRFSPDFLIAQFDSPRLTIKAVALPARPEFVLAVVHFPSKLYWSPDSQALECTRLSSEIRRVEGNRGHLRTVLVGDLNMNPFETGVVGAIGLNATMARAVARRRTRTVQAEEYPFFYNPMWSYLGDGERRACGTYYYESAEHVSYYWHMFDQVMVRPDLLPQLPGDQVKVITETPSTSLLTADGRPNRVAGSDHLPLLFKLDL